MDNTPLPSTVVSAKVYSILEDYQLRHRMTTDELCQKIGKKKQYLSRLKKPGLRMFTRKALEIAEKLDLDINEFLKSVRTNQTTDTATAIGEQFLKAFPNPMIRTSILRNSRMVKEFVIAYEKEFNQIYIEA